MIDEVIVEDTATPDEVAAVKEVFARAGFDVEVDAAFGRRSADVLPWIVSVVLVTPIVAFFASFGAEAGKDAYGAVKAWIAELFAARRKSGNGEGAVELKDPDGTTLILSTRYPKDAIDALARISWDQHRGGYLTWDSEAGEWRDPLKRSS